MGSALPDMHVARLDSIIPRTVHMCMRERVSGIRCVHVVPAKPEPRFGASQPAASQPASGPTLAVCVTRDSLTSLPVRPDSGSSSTPPLQCVPAIPVQKKKSNHRRRLVERGWSSYDR